MEDIVIVVPCYNERARFQAAPFRAFALPGRRARFHFVDDGSTDGTEEVLAGLAAEAPETFAWTRLPQNQGKGEAVRQGLLAAWGPEVKFLGYWDADLSTPLEAIGDLLRELDDPAVWMVLGSRVRLLGRVIDRRAWRHYPGRVFATLASMTLGLAVYDTQCGAKLFRAGAPTRAALEGRFLSRWCFDVELLARLSKALGRGEMGRAVREFPLRVWRDAGGSKVTPLDFFRACLDLARIRARYF